MAAPVVQIASIYIKRAREIGDFDLNKQAETAIEKALQIVPNGQEAKKLLETALKLNPMFELLQTENAQKALSGLK